MLMVPPSKVLADAIVVILTRSKSPLRLTLPEIKRELLPL
jgi:hypothetical protein